MDMQVRCIELPFAGSLTREVKSGIYLAKKRVGLSMESIDSVDGNDRSNRNTGLVTLYHLANITKNKFF